MPVTPLVISSNQRHTSQPHNNSHPPTIYTNDPVGEFKATQPGRSPLYLTTFSHSHDTCQWKTQSWHLPMKNTVMIPANKKQSWHLRMENTAMTLASGKQSLSNRACVRVCMRACVCVSLCVSLRLHKNYICLPIKLKLCTHLSMIWSAQHKPFQSLPLIIDTCRKLYA